MSRDRKGSVWGVIPAAGAGSRMQPLAFSKELLPVGSQLQNGQERPRAVSEYLVERMILGGATKLCFVISPGKTDILEYFGPRLWGADIAYVVQPSPGGLCDAFFRASPLIGEEDQVIVGLPDTIWLPEDALCRLPEDRLSFLLFPVERPELFDAVVTEPEGRVREIQVKQAGATTQWIWEPSRCLGASFMSFTCCGAARSAGTSTSARWSMPGSLREERHWACRVAANMSTSEP